MITWLYTQQMKFFNDLSVKIWSSHLLFLNVFQYEKIPHVKAEIKDFLKGISLQIWSKYGTTFNLVYKSNNVVPQCWLIWNIKWKNETHLHLPRLLLMGQILGFVDLLCGIEYLLKFKNVTHYLVFKSVLRTHLCTISYG